MIDFIVDLFVEIVVSFMTFLDDDIDKFAKKK